MWFRFILLLSFLGSINVITKTTYYSQSYNSPNSIILVYWLPISAGLQFRLFSFLHFSLLMIALSQPLTSFYFLWVFCSYSLHLCGFALWCFHYLLWFFCNSLRWLHPARRLRGFALWSFRYLIFFCHFISIFCLYNTQDCSQS